VALQPPTGRDTSVPTDVALHFVGEEDGLRNFTH